MYDIVSVHQKHCSIRIVLCIVLEGLELIPVEHHPTMSHSAADGYIKHLACRDRSRPHYAADIGSPGPIGGGIHIMSPAGAKIGYRPALPGRLHNTTGLGGDQGLMVDLGQNSRLHQLGINERAYHRQHWLIGIHHRALGHGIDVPVEAEIPQIGQELLRKHILLTEVLNILLRETHILHILNDLLQSGKDGKTAPIRVLTVKDIKNHLGISIMIIEITIGHGHLIEIHHHGYIALIKLGHNRLLC